MSEKTVTTYRYLEPRYHRWKKQLWIKGRNMTAWHLLTWMLANRMTPKEVAKDYDLPVEAVYEALDYYERNKELLRAEAEEEKRRLIARGWKLD